MAAGLTLALSLVLMLGSVLDRNLALPLALFGIFLLITSAFLLISSTSRPAPMLTNVPVKRVTYRESAEETLTWARKDESQGRIDSALLHYVMAGEYFIACAAKECPNLASGVAFLKDIKFAELMAEVLRKWEFELPRVASPGNPALNMHPRDTFTYASWLLSEFELANRWLAIAGKPATLERLRPSNRACTRALSAFANRELYSLPEIKSALGWERYELRYAALVVAITKGEPIAEHIERIDAAFKRWNSSEHELAITVGDKNSPALWDFRKESILVFARHAYPGASS
jgi:hypothetical protein